MANLTAREQIVLNELLKRLALNNGFTENALVADVGTQLADVTALAEALDAGTNAFTKVSYAAATEKTIAAGVITATQSAHRVDTEADAASDDLDTINGGTAEDVLFLRPESGARTVVLKHNTGNIICPGATDISLADAQDYAILVFADSKWTVVAWSTLVEPFARLAGTQSFTGQKTFNHQTLRVANSAATFSSVLESLCTAARAVQLPDMAGVLEMQTTQQILTGPGAVDLTSRTTILVTTGADALTLANGAFVGQRKSVYMRTDGGDGTLTPATPNGFATITFNDVRDSVELEWTAAGWIIISNTGATVA